MGLVPKQTKAENKGAFGLSMQKLVGLMMILSFSSQIAKSMVYSRLTIPFIIGCSILYLLLTRPLPTNPKKALWQGLICWLRDRNSPRYYASIIGHAYQEAYHQTKTAAKVEPDSAFAPEGELHESKILYDQACTKA